MGMTGEGVLVRSKKGGWLRSPERSFRPSDSDPFVPARLVKRFNLESGARIAGRTRRTKQGFEITRIQTVAGVSPKDYAARRPFKELTSISPLERYPVGETGVLSMRLVDLVAPFGKGTRGIVCSPPKAGKTTLLTEIAQAVRTLDPEVRIFFLLIDERPEEVTAIRRSVDAQVLASSADQSVAEHVELAETTLALVQTELECGHDVMVLVDSLTRLGRAFNLSGNGSGRTMSGGLDAGALQIPRRFFGLARKIEGGGSVTIIASALIDTGSRMDQLIFEEFKGTGNSEIILDRTLSEARLFPAIDLAQSGTRREERLYDETDMKRLHKLRKVLAGRKPRPALEQMLQLMKKYPTNRELLDSIPV